MAMKRPRLLTPGPVNLHPAAVRALARPQLHHRSSEAGELVRELRARIAKLANSRGEAVLLGGSGTAAMEAAVRGLFRPGARVWVPVAGKFSERWCEIARAAGLEPVCDAYDWGQAVPPGAVPARPLDGALLTHSETSTGVLQPLAELAARFRERHPEALLAVDAVTSFALTPLRMDDWKLDAVVLGSQKGLMSPPGLAAVVLGPRGLEALRPAGYYLDLARELRAQRAHQTAFTPPINLIEAAAAVMRALEAEGWEARFERVREANEGFYALGETAGLVPVPEPGTRRSPAVAAFYLPRGTPYVEVSRAFAARGWRIAGGQGPLKGSIFRVSAMGYFEPGELERAYGDFRQLLKRPT